MPNTQPEQRYEIGMVGLGVMGRNFLLNMADHGFPVAGYDKDPTKVTALREEAGQRAVRGAAEVMPDCPRDFRPARAGETMQTHSKADIAFGPSVTATQLARGSSIKS